MYRQELETRLDGLGFQVGRYGQGGAGEGTRVHGRGVSAPAQPFC